MRRKMSYWVLPLSFLLTLTSCATYSKGEKAKLIPSRNEHLLTAVSWFQNAGEARALQHQAFNVAQDQLEKQLKRMTFKQKMKMKPAVILDIDETVLDNSAYNAHNILRNTAYPEGWTEWVLKEKAIPIAGALEFLQFAQKNGVEIFYITNRNKNEEEATLANLKAVGFPLKEENLMVKTEKSGKEERRLRVTKNHKVLLLLGDNLNDFTFVFEEKSVSDRFDEVDKWRQEFGRTWIVLPNPSYGDWEGAIYEYNWKKSEAEKNQDLKKSLKEFGY